MRNKELTGKKLTVLDKMELIGTACEQLLTYGQWGVGEKVKNGIKKYLLRRQTAADDCIFWTTGLLAVGLWHCRQKLLLMQAEKEDEVVDTLLQRIEIALSAYFIRWEKKGMPICYLDDLLSGEVFLAAYAEYIQTHKENGIIDAKNAEQYRVAVEKLAEYAFSYPTDETGSFPYRINRKNGHIYVDSVGMTSPFLYQYGCFHEDDEGMELAVKQIANVLAYGTDSASGLPYHGYDVLVGDKYGIIGWGRAVGWLLRGMSGCMTTVYGAERLKESYCNLIDASLIWQRKDGYFSWQLQAMEGPADSSATAMICLALQEGIRTRMIQGEAYQAALDKGIHALQKSIRNGRVYDCLGECEGFALYPQNYDAYPWSLGVALLLDGLAGS